MTEYKRPPGLYKGHRWDGPEVYSHPHLHPHLTRIVWSVTLNNLGRFSITRHTRVQDGEEVVYWAATAHHSCSREVFTGRTARGKALNFLREYLETAMYELMDLTGLR